VVHTCSPANGSPHPFRGFSLWRLFQTADSVCIASRVGIEPLLRAGFGSIHHDIRFDCYGVGVAVGYKSDHERSP
jgi:hypothetical protein